MISENSKLEQNMNDKTKQNVERRRELVNLLYWNGEQQSHKIAYLLDCSFEEVEELVMTRMDFEMTYFGYSKQTASELPRVKYGYIVSRFANKVFGRATVTQLAKFLDSKSNEILVRGLPCRIECYTYEGVCEACSDYGDHDEDYKGGA